MLPVEDCAACPPHLRVFAAPPKMLAGSSPFLCYLLPPRLGFTCSPPLLTGLVYLSWPLAYAKPLETSSRFVCSIAMFTRFKEVYREFLRTPLFAELAYCSHSSDYLHCPLLARFWVVLAGFSFASRAGHLVSPRACYSFDIKHLSVPLCPLLLFPPLVVKRT